MIDLNAFPHDEIDGHIVRLDDDAAALIAGAGEARLPFDVAYTGRVTIGYGLSLLYKKDTLLVEWVYDDFRREHRGEAALDFILRRGDLFPRADVGGWRAGTGSREELFLKQLDLAPGLQAVAFFAQGAAPALLSVAVWVDAAVDGWQEPPADDSRIPPLLRQAVPCWLSHPAALAEVSRLIVSGAPDA